MNEIIKNGLILFAITLIAGALLGGTYNATKAPIAEQAIIQRDKALQNVLKDASFEELTDVDVSSVDKVQTVFKGTVDGEVKGYAFKLVTSEGYGGTLELVAGITVDGKISGIDVIKHAETPGLGAKADEDEFKNRFVDKEAVELTVVKSDAGDQQIDAIGGATITSSAVTRAVNDAVKLFDEQFKEGE